MQIKMACLYCLFLAIILTGCTDPADDYDGVEATVVDFTKFFTGWNDENTERIPDEPNLFVRDNLPSRVDLTPFLPPIGDQGPYGTCVAWACGYYQRTAMWAIRNNYPTASLADPGRHFSPKDLFWSIPNSQKGNNCNGTWFEFALSSMQNRGVATMATVPYGSLGDCSNSPLSNWTNEATTYKIQFFRELGNSVDGIKTKLAEKRPVVFGARLRESFYNWRGTAVKDAGDFFGDEIGGHAMIIVGYDDAKGAFRIANSWGSVWGDDGFAWVDYNLMTGADFRANFFVAYDSPTVNPVNPPVTNGINIAANRLQDTDDGSSTDPLFRTLVYDVKNTASQSILAAKDWDVLYVYVNAYNINDYGYLVHHYITNDYNGGVSGNYANGLGNANRWFNLNLGNGQSLGSALGSGSISQTYQMPALNGEYYLFVIADPYQVLGEEFTYDNSYYRLSASGGPIRFVDGIAQNLQESGSITGRVATRSYHTAVNDTYPNAYRPEEIMPFIRYRCIQDQLEIK